MNKIKTKPSTMILRVPNQLKHKIEKMAHQQGISINQLALYMFTKEVSDLETSDYFEKYRKNKNKKEIIDDFDSVMNKIQNTEIPDWDKI